MPGRAEEGGGGAKPQRNLLICKDCEMRKHTQGGLLNKYGSCYVSMS